MLQKLITFFRVGVGNKTPRRESVWYRTNVILQTFSQEGVTEPSASQTGITPRRSPKLNQKLFDFLKKPVITDKTTKLIEHKIYTFDVDSQLTKKQIKEIFENFYGLPIQSIKTHRIAKKKKRFYNKLKPVKRVFLCFENKQEIPIL